MPFAKGNNQAKGGARSGSGRKPSAYLEQQKQIADATLPADVQTSIMTGMVEKAKDGDMWAAQFLLNWRLKLETLTEDSELNRTRMEQINAQTALSREQLKLLRQSQIPPETVKEIISTLFEASLGFDQRLTWHDLRERTETEEGWDKLRQRKGANLANTVQALMVKLQTAAVGGQREVPPVIEETEGEEDGGL